ncbi:MAG TPA: hypothetical protein VF130_05025, partial [Candidatus Binatia bacterium]
ARQSRNQNEKSRIHHESMIRQGLPRASDMEVFVGCALRTGQSRNISRKEGKGQEEEELFSELGIP